jgi:hypothetical protein
LAGAAAGAPAAAVASLAVACTSPTSAAASACRNPPACCTPPPAPISDRNGLSSSGPGASAAPATARCEHHRWPGSAPVGPAARLAAVPPTAARRAPGRPMPPHADWQWTSSGRLRAVVTGAAFSRSWLPAGAAVAGESFPAAADGATAAALESGWFAASAVAGPLASRSVAAVLRAPVGVRTRRTGCAAGDCVSSGNVNQGAVTQPHNGTASTTAAQTRWRNIGRIFRRSGQPLQEKLGSPGISPAGSRSSGHGPETRFFADYGNQRKAAGQADRAHEMSFH